MARYYAVSTCFPFFLPFLLLGTVFPVSTNSWGTRRLILVVYTFGIVMTLGNNQKFIACDNAFLEAASVAYLILLTRRLTIRITLVIVIQNIRNDPQPSLKVALRKCVTAH